MSTPGGCFSWFSWSKSRNPKPSPTLQQPSLPSVEHKGPERRQYITACDHSLSDPTTWWLSTDISPPAYNSSESFDAQVIDLKVDEIDSQLRSLSMRIHAHPELGFAEVFAHEILTEFMTAHGFTVTKSYLGIATAFRAEYTHGKGGRVVGVNSEYDALKGIGHACGHNLIAVSGCGVAIAIKAALEAHNVAGTVVLLGTPAEEGGGGKVILLEKGGYADMDLCLMCHPNPGPINSVGVATSTALQQLDVEYFGQNAHAAAAPWEGRNALDAAFLAYGSISVLRQQMRPDHRVHGIITSNEEWLPNVIPDHAKMQWVARAPNASDLALFVERVKNCLQAAALATSCEMKLTLGQAYLDLRQNSVLGGYIPCLSRLLLTCFSIGAEFADVMKRYKVSAVAETSISASTDFVRSLEPHHHHYNVLTSVFPKGNVTYVLPALHPGFAIPTEPGQGNHTAGFAKAAASQKAHNATMLVTKGLAHTGFRALRDEAFFKQVKAAFPS
ncbi:Aminoacylase 1-like protein 2 [Mycena indigotica]|uniref:Aminoacylase 1-like protein 2 n=1 Tax=Mycena indigotica TaxID=2126181 RepID=A0A8H6W9L7_9AGAR|nr:Aminoacylase 1-like protein 2 [Mycena indigotica]KAF7309827.1 Aminoacylase 1-like protein 2 [Mycena indigotica]